MTVALVPSIFPVFPAVISPWMNMWMCRRLTLMQFSSAHDVFLDVNVLSAFDDCLFSMAKRSRIWRRSCRIRIRCAQLAMV